MVNLSTSLPLAALLSATALLSGCSTLNTPSEPDSVNTFYDYQLYTPQNQPLELSQWVAEAQQADVILIGEWHTHTGIHRFQTQALQQLITNSSHPVALSMEQFSRDAQPIVDEYLHGEIGEQTLIQQGQAWPNYESDYRPLIEVAKTSNIDVLAANAPKPIIRCIAQQGLSYLDKLDASTRHSVAANIDISDSAYKQKFMASMHHGEPSQHINMYASQLTWDATMAETIVDYLEQHPHTKVLHIAGKFHTEGGLGTAAQINKLNPKLKVMIVTPVATPELNHSDYQLHVLAPPVRYVKKENQQQAYKAMSTRAAPTRCE